MIFFMFPKNSLSGPVLTLFGAEDRPFLQVRGAAPKIRPIL
jgi:hypothetical protein